MNRMTAAIKITSIKRSVSFVRYIIFLPAILVVQISFAQFTIVNNAQDKFRAVHWSLAEGLSNAEVYNMIKDVNGFLWIGTTNGLNRFDGSKFKIFFHDPDDSSTIGGNRIHGIVEDSLHNLWIGTDKGLSRYDMRAGTFSNFTVPAKNGGAILSVIRPLCASRDEVFIEETGSYTITTYNVHSLKKKNLLKLDAPDLLVHQRGLYYDTTTNSLWAVSGKGAESGLIQIETTTGRKTFYRWPCYKKISGHNHQSAICHDRNRNSFWINSTDGLMEFTLADKQFHFVDKLDSWVNLADYESSAGIDTDKEGRVWLSTYPKGIIIYDPSDGSVNLPFSDHPDLQKEVSDELIFLYIDRENIVWTGYWSRKGLYQIIPQETVVTRYAVDSAKPFTHLV